MRPRSPVQAVVTFHKIFSAALSPLRADKSALGTLPAAAFQYCEPVRTASSFGWYIFPPVDIRLMWDGVDVFHANDGDWRKLTSTALSDEFVEYWDMNAPQHLQGCWPPFLTANVVPGIVQIWSGLLVSTLENWSILIGQPSNIQQPRGFSCFEGIVETDTFQPCPLFTNIQILTTDREIIIPRTKPLFQVRPIGRDCYADAALQHCEFEGLSARQDGAGSMTPADWAGYAGTVRKIDIPSDQYKAGAYGAARRKAKRKPD
jgi:hypothetical protein